MKRYWLFVGQEPLLGGMWEFWAAFDFMDQAIDAAKEMTWPSMMHVLELDTMDIVWSHPAKDMDGINYELRQRGV